MKIKHIILSIAVIVLLTGCSEDFLNKTPEAALTEVDYFTKLSQFQSAADYLHTCVFGWQVNTTKASANNVYGINFDYGSDVNSIQNSAGNGSGTVPSTDDYWDQTYTWLRHVNVLLSKVGAYSNKDQIAGPTGQAYFFRAWHHFFLLKRFGGVPIANKVTDVNTDIVYAPRASRYEVMAQIISDLDNAIERLTKANVTKTSTNNDGHVTVEAAKALKARVCLYEGTWEKYVGTKTDGDGVNSGAGSAGYVANKYTEYLQMAKDLSKDIIDGNKFSLWKGVESVSNIAIPNASMYAHTSYFYLFNLEDANSNPNGLTKASNNEAIFRSVFDYTNRKGGMNLTHTKPASPTRKLMDMFLCTDGLPVQYSPLFQGYSKMGSEFVNRDYRLTAQVKQPLQYYWGFLKTSNGAVYTTDITSLSKSSYMYCPNMIGGSGYSGRKFATEHKLRGDNEESADYLHIRLAEIYLIYAEAVCELGNGEISDADLNYSINNVRARAGIAPLTHALIAPYSSLSLLGEIRRERTLELFAEGHRLTDLCRWGIAVEELAGAPVCGVYVSYNGSSTEYATATNPTTSTNAPIFTASAYNGMITDQDLTVSTYAGIQKTKAGAVITEKGSSRNFTLKNYLQPIPATQISLNSNLKQNPNW